jgi:spore coat polysaccharide biosynthesis protein SpsF
MGSERLPGKVLLNLDGQPVIWHVVRRLHRCRQLDDVVVATSSAGVDDELVKYCEATGIAVVRGSEHDVLDRFKAAIAETHADIVVRITADCPLIDPPTVDAIVECLGAENGGSDYASNTVARTYPRGMDAEAFTAAAFVRADRLSPSLAWREHVTPAFYRVSGEFRVRHFTRSDPRGSASWRLTLDTAQDYEAISTLAANFRGRLVNVQLDEFERHLEAHPEILATNSLVTQRGVE